jgi:uncharacterized protein YndB with AHSA1/START domain
MPTEPIHYATVIDAAPADVFAMFTALGRWWPLAYTFAGVDFVDAAIEPRAGGRWFERDARGAETPWGDVRTFERDHRVVLGFAIGADRKPTPPAQASEVEVRFVPEAKGRTRVEVTHRDLDRHGAAAAAALRDGMASPHGWPLILAELRRAVAHAHPH